MCRCGLHRPAHRGPDGLTAAVHTTASALDSVQEGDSAGARGRACLDSAARSLGRMCEVVVGPYG
jgi:hypothetical protein